MSGGPGRRLLEALTGAPVPLAGPDRMVAIPGPEGLRWIVPARLSSASAILGEWRPYNLNSRLLWQALMVAGRLNLLVSLPGIACFDTSLDAIDWSPFGWRERRSPLPLIYVGTAGPRQKLVAILVDRTSAVPPIIVKRALGPDAHLGLRREVEALSAMSGTHPDLAPEILHAASDFSFTVQGHFTGRSAPPDLSLAHVDFLLKLAQPQERIPPSTVNVILTEQRDKLRTSNNLSARELAHVDVLMSHLNCTADIPVVRVHGDFAPWNLKRSSDGSIRAVDWEDSREQGLPYEDLAHHIAVCAQLLRKPKVTAATSHLIRTYGDRLGIAKSTQAALWPLMLVFHENHKLLPEVTNNNMR